MRIHITRHGQPRQKANAGNNHAYPPGDPPLTAQGREQASLLGRHLAAHHFKGPIFSSPYRRTLETSEMVARETDGHIFPTRELQEWVPREGTPNFDGLTLAGIRPLFSRIAPEATLEHPWFFSGPEAIPEVQLRVRPFLEKLCATAATAEVLLVGHGASTSACINELLGANKPDDISEDPLKNWNCSLSTIESDVFGYGKITACFDIGHFAEEIVTSNALRYLDAEEA